MSNWRVWLFRLLVALAGVVMFLSAYYSWWMADIRSVMLEQSVEIHIYAWGFRPDLAVLKDHVAGDFTPLSVSYLAWGYMGLSIGLALASTWLKGRKGRWLLAAVGLVYVLYAIAGFIYIKIRTSQVFGIDMLGYTMKADEGGVEIRAHLETGYYLSYVASLAYLLLALLRPRFFGKSPAIAILQPEPTRVSGAG